MKTKKNLNKKNLRNIAIAILAGLILGFAFFHDGKKSTDPQEKADSLVQAQAQIWTCSMHPQVRLDHPGKCPICGMDLIPLREFSKGETSSAEGILMSEEALKLAEVRTVKVGKALPQKEVRLLGKLEPDEGNIAVLTARFGGRIEKLLVNFTGQTVKKGEKLAIIYSPELVSAQQELIEAYQARESNTALYDASKNKLRLWDLSDKQIREIEEKGEPEKYLDILSPISGTVTMRHVSAGDYVKAGSPLFEVTDLSRLWVMFEAYESDLPWLHINDRVTFTVASVPGETFSGKISFIDPVLNPQTRVASVRVAIENKVDELKPGMFADGTAQSSIAGKQRQILIPETAVLWTGKRSIVYVKIPGTQEPEFEYREITLGPETGDHYVVENGLTEGEEIAVNGVFSIDASAQLSGKVSMMNPAEVEPVAGTGSALKTGSISQARGKLTSPSFAGQLSLVFDQYLQMKNAFIRSDPDQVKKSAAGVSASLKKVREDLLKGDEKAYWMSISRRLETAIGEIEKDKEIEKQREAFSLVSTALYEAAVRFGTGREKAFYQFCPMAVGNRGAYWISETAEIVNPYFGEDMRSCGETRDTLRIKGKKE